MGSKFLDGELGIVNDSPYFPDHLKLEPRGPEREGSDGASPEGSDFDSMTRPPRRGSQAEINGILSAFCL